MVDKLFAKHEGLWKEPLILHAKQASEWKPVKQAWHREGGLWRLFYTTEISENAPAGASVNAGTIFGVNWAADTLKRLIVPQGVITGIITLPPNMGGELVLEVHGEVLGLGGAPNGGIGGNAVVAHQSFTLQLEPTGIIRSGGGGGGRAGNGGNGQYPYTVNEGPFRTGTTLVSLSGSSSNGYSVRLYWNNSQVHAYYSDTNSLAAYSVNVGGIIYSHPAFGGNQGSISRSYTAQQATSGGIAPNAGRGQGYDGAKTNGGAVVAGGTNAGASGKPGDGGDWATAGSAGTAGTNGNVGAGTAGQAGGAPGKAVHMVAGACTVIDNGGLIQGVVS